MVLGEGRVVVLVVEVVRDGVPDGKPDALSTEVGFEHNKSTPIFLKAAGAIS